MEKFLETFCGPQNENPSLFDVHDETTKILNGYYLDINESLNILKEFHDFGENPFFEQHIGSLEYINLLHTQNNILGLKNKSETEKTARTVLKSKNIIENPKKLNGSIKKRKIQKKYGKQNQKPDKMSEKTPKKSRKASENTPNSSISPKKHEKSFQNLPLSPILPSSVHYRFQTDFSPREMQLLEDKKYLEFLETQFNENIYQDNGRTIFPFLTNCDFNGILYDIEDEVRNNEIIRAEIFFRIEFWVKY